MTIIDLSDRTTGARQAGPIESTLATAGRHLDALRWLVREWVELLVDAVVWRGWG